MCLHSRPESAGKRSLPGVSGGGPRAPCSAFVKEHTIFMFLQTNKSL